MSRTELPDPAPELLARFQDTLQVAALLRASAAHRLRLTFRSGGTRLSGQATNDGVLVDTRRNFRGIEILDDVTRLPSTQASGVPQPTGETG
ncbi:FAD-binding protein [Streptomyces ipomoeae]|uniref:FAD-binding protein n=1 Tax=Streptomyces ipomoeae TaxID=103232 RepID=UPI001FD5C3BD|nr:FAD-binding protein [Streptomyces ipomoeae]MDX2938542.1 FAD-binding protein [Streptomyces ipomoeae]